LGPHGYPKLTEPSSGEPASSGSLPLLVALVVPLPLALPLVVMVIVLLLEPTAVLVSLLVPTELPVPLPVPTELLLVPLDDVAPWVPSPGLLAWSVRPPQATATVGIEKSRRSVERPLVLIVRALEHVMCHPAFRAKSSPPRRSAGSR
jgi:hypothetical protein